MGLPNIQVLPQEVVVVDDVEYLITAMPASKGLEFMQQHDKDIDEGKSNLVIMKQVICENVTKDNKIITSSLFDIIFARKFVHLQKLYQEVLKYNFSEVFQEAGSSD